MGETTVSVRGARLTVAEVGARYVAHARRRGRKPSTIENLESEIRTHLVRFFPDRSVGRITAEDVSDLVAALEGKGLAPKSIKNAVSTFSAPFMFACGGGRRRTRAPARAPAVPEATEIRFLTLGELYMRVAHARPGPFQAIDGVLYLTAAMTGLRCDELVALRWRDDDWTAARIRVRQNYVRGRFGTPKSRRSTRSVPMCDAVGGALDRLFKSSAWTGDDDPVFTHPAASGPLTTANITPRLTRGWRTPESTTLTCSTSSGTRSGRAWRRWVQIRTLQEWMAPST